MSTQITIKVEQIDLDTANEYVRRHDSAFGTYTQNCVMAQAIRRQVGAVQGCGLFQVHLQDGRTFLFDDFGHQIVSAFDTIPDVVNDPYAPRTCPLGTVVLTEEVA